MAVTKRSDEDTTHSEGPDDEGPDEVSAADDKADPSAEAEEKASKPAKGEKADKSKNAKGEPKQGKEGKVAVDYARPGTAGPRRGFFTIYKSGQGYWTRMGTLIAVGLLGIMLSYTLYDKIPPFVPGPDTTSLQKEVAALQSELSQSQQAKDPAKKLPPERAAAIPGEIGFKQAQITALNGQREKTAQRVGIGIAVGFLLIYALVAIWLMNKPTNVDFLIATDSEMKKVNWTSRKELIGSTKVVVVFMFLISTLLFVIDQVFHLLFWAGGKGVLRSPPPWWPWQH